MGLLPPVAARFYFVHSTSLLVPVNYIGPGSQMVDCHDDDFPTETIEFDCGPPAVNTR